MTSKNKLKIEDAIRKALTPINEDEKIGFDAVKIQLSFLFKIQDLMDRNGLSRKDLADRMGTSKAYITQLFGAEKFLNMKTIAKIQHILGVEIELLPHEVGVSTNKKKLNIVAENNPRYNN